MSLLRLERIEGLVLHVRDVDLVDGTPVLDLKPYLAYTDSRPGASHGWLGEAARSPSSLDAGAAADPGPRFKVTLSSAARAQVSFLEGRGLELLPRIESVLGSGPSPHPYRRIRRHGEAFILAIQEWRVHFGVEGDTVTVLSVASGYKASEVFREQGPLGLHRDYAERFGLWGEREGPG